MDLDLSLIKKFEKLSLQSYLEKTDRTKGHFKLGYGMTHWPKRPIEKNEYLLNEEAASRLLLQTIQRGIIPQLEKIPTWGQMNDNQKSALISFAYEQGAYFYNQEKFITIKLLLDNPERWDLTGDVCDTFRYYCGSNRWLLQRRLAEAELFLKKPNTASEISESQSMVVNHDTWLKKTWTKQASELDDTSRAFCPKGKEYKFISFFEGSLETDLAGHALVELDYEAGTWYAFCEHWDWPWTDTSSVPAPPIPDFDYVDWTDFECYISKYFTVGEVSLYQRDRIVIDPEHQRNAYDLGQIGDDIREWWGSALLVNSWYRPPEVEKAVGGSGANHPYGYAFDIRPAQGSVWDLQQRFYEEWYKTGKWQGGFGKGAQKGFIHLDLRDYGSPRIWNY